MSTEEDTQAVGLRRRVADIDWYYELRGQGPTVVLVPSGEGDCGSFKQVAVALADQFTVLTFDMPGFSRTSDPPDFASYSMTRAADEVAELVQALGLGPAAFYGCSSGGVVALCLAMDHASLVRNVAVHEVPLRPREGLLRMAALSDAVLVRTCADLFRNQMNENPAAWDALGEAYHRRLERNYVTWIRRYGGANVRRRTFTAEDLRGRPITWTIGGLTPAAAFFDNVDLAHAAGLPIGLLMCRHFPQVSIPDALAAHIAQVANR